MAYSSDFLNIYYSPSGEYAHMVRDPFLAKWPYFALGAGEECSIDSRRWLLVKPGSTLLQAAQEIAQKYPSDAFFIMLRVEDAKQMDEEALQQCRAMRTDVIWLQSAHDRIYYNYNAETFFKDTTEEGWNSADSAATVYCRTQEALSEYRADIPQPRKEEGYTWMKHGLYKREFIHTKPDPFFAPWPYFEIDDEDDWHWDDHCWLLVDPDSNVKLAVYELQSWPDDMGSAILRITDESQVDEIGLKLCRQHRVKVIRQVHPRDRIYYEYTSGCHYRDKRFAGYNSADAAETVWYREQEKIEY